MYVKFYELPCVIVNFGNIPMTILKYDLSLKL